VSIAWAVAEYLHDRKKSWVLFATHYHELTELAVTKPRVRNYNVAVREWNDQIVFLRKIVEGGVSRSYGIQVARLAGLPGDIIRRAREIVTNLETGELDEEGLPRLATSSGIARNTDSNDQLTLFGWKDSSIHRELRQLDTNRLSPLEALQLLYRWKELIDDRER
jgi:DNA mismatch repair protein MutS